jgi:hypothetical protein
MAELRLDTTDAVLLWVGFVLAVGVQGSGVLEPDSGVSRRMRWPASSLVMGILVSEGFGLEVPARKRVSNRGGRPAASATQ